MKNSVSVRAAWSVCLAVLVLTAAGCGPTRKEYAINEALLIDQTRILENQLYSAHFQIQKLEQENKQLRARLEAKGEKADDIPQVELYDSASVMPVSRVNAPRPSERYMANQNRRPNPNTEPIQQTASAGQGFNSVYPANSVYSAPAQSAPVPVQTANRSASRRQLR